jgi:hypothetical protein
MSKIARARQADSSGFAQTTSNLKPWFCKTELAREKAVNARTEAIRASQSWAGISWTGMARPRYLLLSNNYLTLARIFCGFTP